MKDSVYSMYFPDRKGQDHCHREMESNAKVNPNDLVHICIVAHDKRFEIDPLTIMVARLQIFERDTYESIIL